MARQPKLRKKKVGKAVYWFTKAGGRHLLRQGGRGALRRRPQAVQPPPSQCNEREGGRRPCGRRPPSAPSTPWAARHSRVLGSADRSKLTTLSCPARSVTSRV